MDFTLTHEQQMIQQMAREFAQQELLPGVLERDEKSEFPLEQFRKFGQTAEPKPVVAPVSVTAEVTVT